MVALSQNGELQRGAHTIVMSKGTERKRHRERSTQSLTPTRASPPLPPPRPTPSLPFLPLRGTAIVRTHLSQSALSIYRGVEDALYTLNGNPAA